MTAFNFFANQAFSVGHPISSFEPGHVWKHHNDQKRMLKKLVFKGDFLIGAMFLNETVDLGIIVSLIRRRVDMSPHKEALLEGTKPLSNPWLRFLSMASGNR